MQIIERTNMIYENKSNNIIHIEVDTKEGINNLIYYHPGWDIQTYDIKSLIREVMKLDKAYEEYVIKSKDQDNETGI